MPPFRTPIVHLSVQLTARLPLLYMDPGGSSRRSLQLDDCPFRKRPALPVVAPSSANAKRRLRRIIAAALDRQGGGCTACASSELHHWPRRQRGDGRATVGSATRHRRAGPTLQLHRVNGPMSCMGVRRSCGNGQKRWEAPRPG